MIEIPLTQGKVAFIDDEDWELVSQFKWQALNYHKTWYARTNIKLKNGKRSSMLMHRLIMGAKLDQQVDHINGDGWDNRKSRLRFATKSENKMNQRNKLVGGSQYKGISRDKNMWKARITVDGEQIYLGYFDNEIEAAKVYDQAAKKLFREFACLNFGG